MSTPERDASRHTFPTPEQRKTLIGGALEFADLLPPGPDRTQFLEVARSLSFLVDIALHKNDDSANQPTTSHHSRPFSIVRGPNNVVEINMSSAVFHNIRQQAEEENVPLGQAITAWVKGAIKSDLIGLH